MDNSKLIHHGIRGQKWGIRRYQNEDGSYTEAGLRRIEKKDTKWANKHHDKIQNRAFKASKKELSKYVKDELNPKYANSNRAKNYINEYNRKMAELMNQKVTDLKAPSGKVVRFVAKRGEIGVHLALATPNYDMSQVKNGVWSSGKIAYKKKSVEVANTG